MIVASPLKRTVYTALLSFPNKKLPVILLPELQETSDAPCDTGSTKAEITREFHNSSRVDMHLVTDGWNVKTGKYSPSKTAIEERAKLARRWLKEQNAKDIAVVTHGGLLHFLTEDWADMERYQGTGWANTEYRSYRFDPLRPESASLIETEESKTRRRGLEKPLTESEQRNLRQTTNVQIDRNVKPEQELRIPAKV